MIIMVATHGIPTVFILIMGGVGTILVHRHGIPTVVVGGAGMIPVHRHGIPMVFILIVEGAGMIPVHHHIVGGAETIPIRHGNLMISIINLIIHKVLYTEAS